jgi:hypothetical protein
LQRIATERRIELEVQRRRSEVAAAVQPELADRLLFRLFGALADRCDRGERLQLSVEQAGDRARIAISRPAALKGLNDSELLDMREEVQGIFPLRLVRGLARIAGGDLVSTREAFALAFPRA